MDRSEHRWLSDTYWMVPVDSLLALQLDPGDNTLAFQVDQTVWHFTGYRDGYVWGVSATLLVTPGEAPPAHGRGSKPVPFAVFGSVTPEGRVHLTFLPAVASSGRAATVGIGEVVRRGERWSLEMQMSSGSSTLTAHWAYMVQVSREDPEWNNLPGVGLSVPKMLAGCTPPAMKSSRG